VVNVSEGRDEALLGSLADVSGPNLLDIHRDAFHHRAVFTLVGGTDEVEEAAFALAVTAVDRMDLAHHAGAHPRLGVIDVVPFVSYQQDGRAGAVELAVPLRDRFAERVGRELGLPAFRYGPVDGEGERSLPEVRRHAFKSLAPDFGPKTPHPTAGAVAVGARKVLVAYNVWARGLDLATAQLVARELRESQLRILAFDLNGRIQISCNLIAPYELGPAIAFDRIAAALEAAGGAADGGELVGLLPEAVLNRVPETRWPELGLSAKATVESRFEVARSN
jgi:glutamate formiminotransferase / 5-formyltetrahydrofolate cyclo-ligase